MRKPHISTCTTGALRKFSYTATRARLGALLIIVALAATAGLAATSPAGPIKNLIFGTSLSTTPSPDSGGGLRAVAKSVMAMLSPAPQASQPTLLNARRGHTATQLEGGKVLIVGGDDMGTAEVFDAAAGTFAVTNGMSIARSDHTATKLADGRVIVIGGRSGGTAVASTEVYDTTTSSFLAGPSLGVARAGHSATLLSDGRILVAGGDGSDSAEIFNPATGAFSTVDASLGSARTMHSAALMLDGRVLLVGGRDADGSALKTAEVFHPADSSFTAVPGGLTTSRVLPHLRVLFDGKVQIIGGSDDGSMEVYDPSAGVTGANVHVIPETDTCAGLPTAVLASQTRAALFHNGQTDPLLDRTGHTITELPGTNQALVAGGVNSSGAVLSSASVLNSSPATITTDKLDYVPGETATLTGRGWQPGETVRLKIHEDPHTPQERGLDVVADADGNITGEYLVQDYDLNMKFIVGARGLTSGRNAQTTFTDANNDAHVAPGWAATNTTVTFNTLYRKTTGGAVQHVRITLPVGYTNISVPATAFSSGTWSTPVINQVTRTIDVQLTAGTGLATNNVSWARIDVTATTPLVNQSGNAAEWLMQTFTDTAGTAGEQNDNPPVLIGNITNPSATVTFVDAGGNPIVSPVLQNNVAATVRVRVTQSGNGIKYTDIAVPTCFSSPTGVTTTVSTGGNGGYSPSVTDGFIRMPGGSIPTNGSLTVQFTTTPNCTSGTYTVSSTPSTNASNPPSGTNQAVSTTGGSLTIAAGLADLSITKADSPDPVSLGGALTYTIGVTNAGPNPASAVKVVDTLPAGTTFINATGTSWNCNHVSGTVTCNRTGGNLAPGAAPNITITVTAPITMPPSGTITNSATVSSPNDNTPNNNTATAITVINRAPTANSQSVSTNEETAKNITLQATDPDGNNLTFSIVGNPTSGTLGSLGAPSCSVSSGTSTCTASVTYTPNSNYNGPDSFTFEANDGSLDSNTATVSITVDSVNDTPDAVNDSATIAEDSGANSISVLANDTDPDNVSGPANAGLTVTAVTQGARGSVTFNASGVSYTPGANYYGADSFTYTISDTGGATDTATVDVTVTNVNDSPDAVDDSATVAEDGSANSITVLANDTDPDNLSAPFNAGLTVTAKTDGAHGAVAITGGGTGLTYTPAPNYYGSDSFTYTISDGDGATDTATVNVTITNVNDPPDAVNDSPAAFVEDSVDNVIDVLANDTDADNLSGPANAGLSVTAVTQGAHGSVSFTASGVKYTPAANYYGPDTFTYTISDGAETDTATVTVSVTNVNDTPDAVDDSPAAFIEDSTGNAIDVLSNDTDPDNLSGPANVGLSVTAVMQGAHGSVTFTATGVSYTPNANYYGADSFTYTISDADGATDTATVSVSITNVNDTPDAGDDSAAAFMEDSTNNAIDVLANDTDPDNLSGPANAGLTVTAVTQGAHGSVTFTATGVSYTSNANYYGSDSFTYTISDGEGATDTATVTVSVTNVNDTPDALDDSPAAFVEDSSNNAVDVLANDTDPDNLNPPANAGLTVTAVTQGTHGSVTFTPSGVSYTPAPNYYGSDSFTYTISDGDGATDTATVAVSVMNVNDTPDAVDDAPGAFVEDSANNAVDVLANDTDPDNLNGPANAGLSVTAVTQGTHGSVTFTASGVSYTPNANYYGSDSFTYTISDADGATDTAAVSVTITNVNDTPDAVDDTPTALVEDSTNNAIDVLTNDSDPDNLTPPANAGLSVTAVTQGAHGSVTFTASGVAYTPAPNYYGSDSFTYTITDADGATDTAAVTVSITNVNDPPDAVDDSPASFVEDSTNNAVDVLANDTDPDNLSAPFNAGLSVTAVTQGTHGSVTFNASGVSYTPNANFYGTDSFTYTISDADGATDTATVNVTVTNVNDTPDAVDDSPAAFVEDSTNNSVDVLANDTDPDNLSGPANAGLTVTAVTQGAHGSVAITGGGTSVSYTPAANYYGSDSFTYTISDADGATDTATVSVTITNVNDTPDAVDDTPTAFVEDSTNNAIDVLSNDTDADNLSGPANAGLSVTAVTQGTHGSVTFSAGGVSYTPNANYYGSDSFTYTLSDADGATDTATVSVTVTNVNDSPDAVDDSPAPIAEDSGANSIDVLANDTDPDNLTPPANAGLSVTAVTQGTHGSVTFTATGVSYTPNANYYGSDSFTYTISDSEGANDTATVNVTITNVNDTPDAVNDSPAAFVEDSTNNSVDVLANDKDADNLSGPANAGLSVTAVTQGAHGSVSFTATGVSYTPSANYYGPDSFTYTISDGDGATDTATVTVSVTNVNDTPDAVDDSPAAFTEDSTSNAIDVLANDADSDNLSGPANTGLSITAVTQGTHGSVTFTASGVSYTPNANYYGSDSFTYTISDADGATDTATVSVTVSNVNDTPDAVDDSPAAFTEDSIANSIDVLANDTDPDNLTPPANAGLSVTVVTQGTHGSVAITGGGTGVSYTPNANYYGSDSFTYTISDADGAADTATVTVSITNVNDPPDAVDDAPAAFVEDSTNNSVDVLANDTDPDNLSGPANAGLSVTAKTDGAHGTVAIIGGGTGVTYTPAANFNGPDSFTYTISDADGATDTATVNVTVTPVNDAPANLSVNVAPGSIDENATATVSGSFMDPDDGDTHTVTISWGDGSAATVINLAAGVFTYSAPHQYKDDNPTNTSTDVNSIMVTVTDNGSPQGTATANTSITVKNVEPIITSVTGPAGPQPLGSPSTVTASFTDVGTQDTHTCKFVWDDGTTTDNVAATETNGSGTCTASRTFAGPGVYSVVVTVTDDDKGSASRALDLTYVVIFDPNGGFVTGGGWIMSPAGACRLTPACLAATGKSNFGFVSKYKKGSNIPDGQTEFQFKAGDINFHSSAYDLGSLVVSGHKAQYRGTGDINGEPGYKFVLTAYDGQAPGGGGVDKFRMKITKNGVVVYDNRMGVFEDMDNADPMAISGGSIVIHK